MGEDIVRSPWRHGGYQQDVDIVKTSVISDEVLTRTNGVMMWALSQRRAR